MDKGRTVYVSQPYRAVKRIGQWLPERKRVFDLIYRDTVYLMCWRPGLGLYVRAWKRRGQTGDPYSLLPPLPRVMSMKRRDKLIGQGVVPPAAPHTSVLMAKLAPVLEWCALTSYEDGSPRTPGTFRIATRGQLWSFTVTDPDAAARLTVVSGSPDETLKLLVAYLGADNAPWEPDPYAQRPQTAPKSRKAS